MKLLLALSVFILNLSAQENEESTYEGPQIEIVQKIDIDAPNNEMAWEYVKKYYERAYPSYQICEKSIKYVVKENILTITAGGNKSGVFYDFTFKVASRYGFPVLLETSIKRK